MRTPTTGPLSLREIAKLVYMGESSLSDALPPGVVEQLGGTRQRDMAAKRSGPIAVGDFRGVVWSQGREMVEQQKDPSIIVRPFHADVRQDGTASNTGSSVAENNWYGNLLVGTGGSPGMTSINSTFYGRPQFVNQPDGNQTTLTFDYEGRRISGSGTTRIEFGVLSFSNGYLSGTRTDHIYETIPLSGTASSGTKSVNFTMPQNGRGGGIPNVVLTFVVWNSGGRAGEQAEFTIRNARVR